MGLKLNLRTFGRPWGGSSLKGTVEGPWGWGEQEAGSLAGMLRTFSATRPFLSRHGFVLVQENLVGVANVTCPAL